MNYQKLQQTQDEKYLITPRTSEQLQAQQLKGHVVKAPCPKDGNPQGCLVPAN